MTLTIAPLVALTVTYGDRSEACLAMIESALTLGADSVLIVNNGASARSRAALLSRAALDPDRIKILSLPENLGPAAGYVRGLRDVMARGPANILLLDDDNVVTLSAGLSVSDLIDDLRSHRAPAALALLRTADPAQCAVASGSPVRSVYDRGGEFFGFDIVRRLSRGPRPAHTSDGSAVQIPRAPYGGLLTDTRSLEIVGLPSLDYVLYGDDYEFTERYAKHGGAIWLRTQASVEDVTDRWQPRDEGDYMRRRGGNLRRMIESRDASRSYYLLRNTATPDRFRARRAGRRARFIVNGLVFGSYTLVLSIAFRRPGFLKIFFRAQTDALRGRMGPTYPLPSDTTTALAERDD